MPDPTRPTVRLRMVGRSIRRYRKAQDMTLERAAVLLERSPSSLSKIEMGKSAAAVRDLRAIFGVLDVPQATVDRLLTLAAEARRSGWWEQYDTTLSPSYLDFITLEDDADSTRTFETVVVPGLLQTPAYARAVIDSTPESERHVDVETMVDVRLARQQVLTRQNALRIDAVITEGALRQQIGGPSVLHRQLLHLADMAQRDNVTLRVLPFTATALAGVSSPFVILGFEELTDLDVVLIEHATSGLYLEEDPDIQRYNLLFESLVAATLSTEDSVMLIKQVAEELT